MLFFLSSFNQSACLCVLQLGPLSSCLGFLLQFETEFRLDTGLSVLAHLPQKHVHISVKTVQNLIETQLRSGCIRVVSVTFKCAVADKTEDSNAVAQSRKKKSSVLFLKQVSIARACDGQDG